MWFSALERMPTTGTGSFSFADRVHQPEHGHAAALVEDHVAHLVGRLDRDAAGVEGDGLADDEQERLPCFASRLSFLGPRRLHPPGRCSSTIIRGGCRAAPARRRGCRPCRASAICFSSSTRTSSPTSRASSCATFASVGGLMSLPGREAIVRAKFCPSAMTRRARRVCGRRASPETIVTSSAHRPLVGILLLPGRPFVLAEIERASMMPVTIASAAAAGVTASIAGSVDRDALRCGASAAPWRAPRRPGGSSRPSPSPPPRARRRRRGDVSFPRLDQVERNLLRLPAHDAGVDETPRQRARPRDSTFAILCIAA